MGNVGAGVYKNLANNRILLMETIGAELMVQTATNARINSAIDKIAKLACVKRPPRLIRVETFSV